MDVGPTSEKIVYRIESSTFFEAEVGIGVKKRRRCSFEAASKICKRAE